jgi:hypothetical protein
MHWILRKLYTLVSENAVLHDYGQVGARNDLPLDAFGPSGRSVDDVSLELPDSVQDSITEMHKRWNNRLVWNTLDIAKEYSSGRLEVFIAVNPDAGINLDIASPIPTGLEHDVLAFPSGSAIDGEELDALHASGLDDGEQDGVFLCVVDLAKPINKFPRPIIVNGKFDEEVDGALKGCYYPFAGCFKIDPVVAGRKFRLPVPGSFIEADKLPSGMIKRRSEVVKRVAENEGQAGRQPCVENNFEEQRAIFVTVDVNSVSVVPSKCFKGSFKVTDVLVGPLNF